MTGIRTPEAVVSIASSSLAGEPSPTREEDQLRRVGSQTAVYVIGVLIGRAFSFLLLPVYTRYLSPADYGIIQLIDLTFDVLTLVAGTRLAAGLFHFHEKASTVDQKNQVLSTTMIALAGAYAIVAGVAAIFASTLSQLVFDAPIHTTLIRIASVSFLCQGLLIVPLAEIRRREQPRLFVALNSGKLILQAGLNVFFLVVMKYGLFSMFLSTLITSAIFAIGLTGYLIRQAGLHFSAPILRNLIRFGLPLVATQVATIFTTFGDRFFLRRSVDEAFPGHPTAGVAAVGIYALAYQFGFLLAALALDPFSSVWQPVRFKLAQQDNRDSIFSRAFIMLNVMLVTIGVGIGLFVHDLLNIIAAPAFRSASDLVPLLLLAYVVASWPAAQETGIMIRERNELITYANWASAGVALIGYLVLIPLFFAWGAVWTTLAAAVTRHIIIYRASQRLWPIEYEWWPVWKLLCIGIGLVALRQVVHIEWPIVSIGFSAVLFVVYLLGVWYSDILPQSVRASLFQVVRSPRGAMMALLQDAPDPSSSPVEIPAVTGAIPKRMPRPSITPGKLMIRTIGREELGARLEWGMEFFKNASYQVMEWPGVNLLTARRFDILAKTVFAEHLLRGVRSDYGERLYAEHIQVWNGFHESKPPKSGRNDFVDSFRTLIAAVKAGEFSPDKSLVPVDRFGQLIDGAHRVAAMIAAGSSVQVVQAETALQDRRVPEYDYRFFATSRSYVPSGLAEHYSDEMARMYCRLKPDARLVILFPVANRRYDPRVLDILAEVGSVVYARSFFLNRTGALQFVRHLYQHDERGWMGSRKNGFAGAREKARRCFAALAPCRVILLDPVPGADLLEAKRRIRDLHGLHDAVHISDSEGELPLVSGFVFNRNSVEFFNRERSRAFEYFDDLFERYDEAVRGSGESREDLAVHGSGPIAAAGLRDSRDLDFVGHGSAGERIEASGISRRPHDEVVTPDYVDSVLFDPANHFWYFGQKFATLEVVRQFKIHRNEIPKDPQDVALIDQILNPTRWDQAVTSYFSMVGMRRGSSRDLLRSVLARVGLLERVRRLRR